MKTIPNPNKLQPIQQSLLKSDKPVRILWKGLHASARSFAIAGAVKEGIHWIVCADKEKAAGCANDLYHLLDEGAIFFFPLSENKGVKTRIHDASQKVQRTAALGAIQDFQKGESKLPYLVLVTFPESMQELVPDVQHISKQLLLIKKGDSLGFENLKSWLVCAGFNRCDFVSQPGEFAVRGGLVDLFSYGDDKACRVEFFGDEVESIKIIDVNSQRSVEEVGQVEVYPNLFVENSEQSLVCPLSLTPEKCTVWTERESLLNDVPGIQEHRGSTVCFSTLYEGEAAQAAFDQVFEYPTQPQPAFNKNFELLANNIRSHLEQGWKVTIFSESSRQIDRLRSILSTFDVHPDFKDFTIQGGFVDPQTAQCLYTDHQIFERYRRVKIKRTVERSERLTLEDLNSFKYGDYVVHVNHGICRYTGLIKSKVNGKMQEAVKLEFQDNGVLLVSVHNLHRISRYKSADSKPPKISKLGSSQWQKLKNQTKSKVKDMAQELIRLYAKRRLSKGFAFSGDTFLQHELESSFMYEDTPDQYKATQAIKEDMEQPYPMDRLVCGDVGFGKTEVAIRAAFKAVADSKQVAVLVPTTILALQHYNTFRDRLKDFPCEVEYVSRMKTAAEMRDIADRLKKGQIDILIGTHRLLNKDLIFKDLGLLIIDEEQKFGVAAKEKLRQMKVAVDTLTLSATPIPRTLQFSLLGARDLSVINTPPPNRLPVQTEIIDFEEELVREIIQYEVGRGGQVIYVHNRVEDILDVEDILLRIVPHIKICVAHGQMDPRQMEKKVLDFVAGDYDLLLATTIIESGVDIPNVNTIIINQAHYFGLSDLHQLRGRVGRSNKKAFCYLIVPPTATLTDDALRRIKAIEAFSELGSGFNIAMQDLDIRGMGNMLGAEQSGYMAEMGFDTYQRILAEAFEEVRDEVMPEEWKNKKEEPVEFVRDCTVETDLELFIPDEYINVMSEKIRVYREMDAVKTEAELEKILESLRDRFGPVPEQVDQLAYVVRLRQVAREKGFERVDVKNEQLVAYFVFDQQSPYYQSPLFADLLQRLSTKDKKRYVLQQNKDKLTLTVDAVRTIKGAYNVIQKL